MAWTDERIELLRKSWEAGMTASQIAEVLAEGVSRNAVIGKAHRLGLQPRPSPVKAGEVVLLAAGEMLVVDAVEVETAEGGAIAGAAASDQADAAGRQGDNPAEVAASEASQGNEATSTAAAPAFAAVPRKPSRPAAAPRKPARTTLLDLSEKICKWPIGHPGEADFHFCGKPSQASFPYCSEHCAIAYQAQMPRRDRSRPPPPVMPGMGRR